MMISQGVMENSKKNSNILLIIWPIKFNGDRILLNNLRNKVGLNIKSLKMRLILIKFIPFK